MERTNGNGRATRRAATAAALFAGAPAHLYGRPNWFAARTRSRAEKKAVRLLRWKKVEAYVPLVERERRWSDRTRRVKFPLFPGYIFVRVYLSEMLRVTQIPVVASVVANAGYPTPIREDELEAVRRLAEAATETGVEPLAAEFLEPGQPIVVTGGPFDGLVGVMFERRGGTRVAVKLGAIRQAVSIEMDRRYVSPLPPRTTVHESRSAARRGSRRRQAY